MHAVIRLFLAGCLLPMILSATGASAAVRVPERCPERCPVGNAPADSLERPSAEGAERAEVAGNPGADPGAERGADRGADRGVMLQVKANALWALVGTLNLGVEIQLDPSCSIDLPVWYSPYNMGSPRRKWRLLAMQPEVRWWWQGRAGEGHYAGAHLTVAGFNVAFKGTERYQDPNQPALGFGLGYGYTCRLDRKRRWWLDLNVGAGFICYRYDTFDNAANGRPVGHGKGTYWGVTRASVGIAYRWMWHHRRQKGGEP